MNFLKDKNKLRDVATLTTATLATLSLATTNPAVAALFKIGFCGQFLNSNDQPILPDTQVYPLPINPDPANPPLNKVLPSYIIVESTETGNAGLNFGIKDAKIQTQRVDLTPSILTYNFSDLESSTVNSDEVTWTFKILGNIFKVNIPQNILGSLNNPGPNPINVTNSEMRLNQIIEVKDPDRLRIIPVPEPTSILGTAIAIGLGGMLTKKNLSKLKDDKEAA